MNFQSIEGRATRLIGYLLSDPGTGEAIVVDPPRGQMELILALLAERGLRLTQVLRTHVHRDDPDDCAALCLRSGAVLVVGEGAPCDPGGGVAHLSVAHDAKLVFGAEVVRTLATPGHTPACVGYLWRDRLLCGDVFELDPGVQGEADPAHLFDSLTRRIFTLPDQTLVFPAHPIRGRRVAILAELRARYAPMLARGRDGFVAGMARGWGSRPAVGKWPS